MKIAFISTHGAVRGIIAETVAKKLSRLALLNTEIYSAGVEPAQDVPAEVLQVLKEKGYSVDKLSPKGIKDIPYESIQVLVTLSPEARDRCPYHESHMRREHWTLEEVKTLDRHELLKLTEHIENLIKALFKLN